MAVQAGHYAHLIPYPGARALRQLFLILVFVTVSPTTFATTDEPFGIVELGQDALFSVSSTGKEVAYWNPKSPADVVVLDIETGETLRKSNLDAKTELLWLGYLGDGVRLCAVSASGTLISINMDSPALYQSLDVPPIEGGSFALSGDGEYLAYAGQRLQIWEVRTGRSLISVQTDSGRYASFTEAGDKALLLDGRSARFWKRGEDSLEEIQVNLDGKVKLPVRSHFGRYVAATTKDRILLFDLINQDYDPIDATEHDRVIFDESDTVLAVVRSESEHNRTPVDTWKLGATLTDRSKLRPFIGRSRGVSTYRDGMVFCWGQDIAGALSIHDFHTDKTTLLKVRVLLSNEDYKTKKVCAELLKGSKLALVATEDGVLSLWDLNSSQVYIDNNRRARKATEVIRVAACRGAVLVPKPISELFAINSSGSAIVKSPNGHTFLVPAAVSFPEVTTLKVEFSSGVNFLGNRVSLDFSRDAQKLAITADEFVYVVDTKTGIPQRDFQGDYLSATFSPDGNKLLLLGERGSGLADLSSGKLAPLPKLGAPTGNFRGGRLVVESFRKTADHYETKAIFDVATAELVNVVTLEKLWKTQARLNSESTVMSVLGNKNGFDSFVDLIDVRTGKGTGQMKIPYGVTHLSLPLKQEHNVGVICSRGFATFDMKVKQMKSLIPYTRYWLSQHPELTSKEVFLRDDNPYSDRRDLRDEFYIDYDFFGTEFYVSTGNISEEAGVCLFVERGRLSLWNLRNGDLLWVGYDEKNVVPISAAFSRDGNLAAVITRSAVQIINFTSLIKRMHQAEN